MSQWSSFLLRLGGRRGGPATRLPAVTASRPWLGLNDHHNSLVNTYYRNNIHLSQWLSTKTKSKKIRSQPSVSGVAGRIVLQEGDSSQKSKMCVGCGTEVMAGGGRAGEARMVTGEDALHPTKSKTKAKKLRYVDLTDKDQRSGFLCQRCKALQSNNIWKAYDALRDVSPKVFMDQLKHIVKRRRFGLCVMVVDATDPEHTAISRLRDAVGSTPIVLVINKIDLVPRMTYRDQKDIIRKLSNKSARTIAHYAVSAKTGAGLVELAQGLLEKLGGRDVFVVGSANTGKSTLVKRLSALIADSVKLKGSGKAASKRREMTHNLQVTGSNLPGTTLQALRVPCFPSKGHALWDTPGIINSRALQYHLFPSHLMEPLTKPAPIEVPTRDNGLVFTMRAGQSILIDAPWMTEREEEEDGVGEGENKEREQPFVLARTDLVGAREGVYVQAFIHPSLSVRVIPTELAPSTATIPSSHIERIKQRIKNATQHKETGLKNSYSLPLKSFATKERPMGEFMAGDTEYLHKSGKYSMDLSFASLGWVQFFDQYQYTVIPHCVLGSVFSKRRGLYPPNLDKWLERHEDQEPESDLDAIGDETKRIMRLAAEQGRHESNTRKGREVHYDVFHYGDKWN